LRKKKNQGTHKLILDRKKKDSQNPMEKNKNDEKTHGIFERESEKQNVTLIFW